MGGEQKRESVVSMSQTNSNFQSDGTDYKKKEMPASPNMMPVISKTCTTNLCR